MNRMLGDSILDVIAQKIKSSGLLNSTIMDKTQDVLTLEQVCTEIDMLMRQILGYGKFLGFNDILISNTVLELYDTYQDDK